MSHPKRNPLQEQDLAGTPQNPPQRSRFLPVEERALHALITPRHADTTLFGSRYIRVGTFPLLMPSTIGTLVRQHATHHGASGTCQLGLATTPGGGSFLVLSHTLSQDPEPLSSHESLARHDITPFSLSWITEARFNIRWKDRTTVKRLEYFLGVRGPLSDLAKVVGQPDTEEGIAFFTRLLPRRVGVGFRKRGLMYQLWVRL